MNKLRCILIAEDDPKDLELLQTSLAELNLSNPVIAVRDGAEALDFLYKRGAYEGSGLWHPAVVLLDIKMPKVDGIQVLKKIKSDENLRRIPVVMLTSSREESDLMTCYELGSNAYVVKPMKFGDFATAIRDVGAFWAVVNEPPP
jgi:CheY-like chemotaxis protein